MPKFSKETFIEQKLKEQHLMEYLFSESFSNMHFYIHKFSKENSCDPNEAKEIFYKMIKYKMKEVFSKDFSLKPDLKRFDIGQD